MNRAIPPGILVLCVTASFIAGADERQADSANQFTRSALLRRFDKNLDKKLDRDERRAARAAFGGIDIPMLPSKTTDYQTVKRPNFVTSEELSDVDNTPQDNPITNAGATLGRVLFYDRHLSKNNSVSCATCHEQKSAFADRRRFSVGFNKGHTKRNSMGLANIRFTNVKGREPGFFWDERADTVEAQVLLPIQDKVEMGMELPALTSKLQQLPYYPQMFAAAFGTEKVTSQRISQAIAQFMRAMVSFDSKFDRGAAAAKDLSDDFKSFSARENLGKSLFIDGIGGIAEYACAMCHAPPTFNMSRAFNIGLNLKYKDIGLGGLKRPSNDPFTPSNDGKFKAPSLRNIALTAPYMHDGRFKTLEEVVDHYSEKVHAHPNLGLALEEPPEGTKTSGLRYDKEQKAAVVAFLKTLTDTNFVNDPRFSDPFLRLEKTKE